MTVGSNPFPPRRRDDFDEWFHTPVVSAPPDPRTEIRRAHPSEYDRIYDLVDEVFGFKRRRDLNEWMYRDNRLGLARSWVAVERATGKFVGAVANWRWPVARGTCSLPAAQGGDAVLSPEWRHHGTFEALSQIRQSHPWFRSVICFAWPNARSAQRIRDRHREATLIGVLPTRILPLQAHHYLARRGVPRPIAAAAGSLLDTLFTSWSHLLLKRPFDGHIVQISRFDATFDEVTQRCLSWDGYWSPHDAEFLNWHYMRDPVREHLAFALEINSRPAAYSVVRVSPERAYLMEFAVPPEQPEIARALPLHTIKAAAAAGCSQLAVAAPPRWRHWQLLRAAGFMSRPSTLVMNAFSWRDDASGVQALDNWQILGGDLDPFYD
jgi:hypothetical protein